MADKTERSSDERQLVIFKISSEEFGVNIDDVREIIKMAPVTKIPNSEAYILGVINLRGKIIVIVDLAKKLNISGTLQGEDTRIIVIEVAGSTVGMVVDGCNEVLRLSNSNIEPAPEIIHKKINSDYLEGVGILNQRLIILLDLAKALNAEELQKMVSMPSVQISQ